MNEYTSYADAIREGFAKLMSDDPDVFTIGQGLWSPWYVGSSMTKLEEEFGKTRVIDTPISEFAVTSAAVGASLCGKKPIVIHPRMDFMILAADSIVNQAAKWNHMMGGQSSPQVTFRAIINRGGEQGAQHSQSLQSWFAHIPGLRVVMPYTVSDARDLLISSCLCPDPVLYIDDRWLYENIARRSKPKIQPLEEIRNEILVKGTDITLVGCSWGTHVCVEATKKLEAESIFPEIIDLRILNPLDVDSIVKSVKKTGRLLVVDFCWKNCGIAGEIIASVVEQIPMENLRSPPKRITLPECPAPTSPDLEKEFYPNEDQVVFEIEQMLFKN